MGSIRFFRELYRYFFFQFKKGPLGYLQHQRAIHTVDLLTLTCIFFSRQTLELETGKGNKIHPPAPQLLTFSRARLAFYPMSSFYSS